VGDLALEWSKFCRDLIGSGVQLQKIEDELIWTGGDNLGILSVKNVYNSLAKKLWQQPTRGWRRHLWPWDVTLKIGLYTWLAVENKILTWDNLQKKGWEGPSLCHLCSRDSETVLPLLVKCIFIQQVWHKIKIALNLKTNWEGNNLITCFDSWIKKERNYNTLPSLACWFIWLERNKKIFDNGTPSIHSVVFKSLGKLDSQLGTRKVSCHKNFKIPCHVLPTVGWFDGATQENGLQSGVGGDINSTDNTIYKWTLNCGPGTNTRA
jgi:hypothetical protein